VTTTFEWLLKRWQVFWARLGNVNFYARSGLGWEDITPIPVVQVGYVGGDSDTENPKIWPTADGDGYHPLQETVFRNTAAVMAITEIPGGGATLGVAGQYSEGGIYIPAGATLTYNGTALPAMPANVSGIFIPLKWYGAVTCSSAGVSSWGFRIRMDADIVDTNVR